MQLNKNHFMSYFTKLITLFLFFTCLTIGNWSSLKAQNDVDTLQRFSNMTGDAKHHKYSGMVGSCNYGYIFGQSCQEYHEYAEKFTVNDTAVIEGLFGYIASDETTVESQDSAAFNIYRDSSNFPGDTLAHEKISIQSLTVNSIFGINTAKFNNFTQVSFSDSVLMYPDSSFFASFSLPSYRNNFNAPGNTHQDTLVLRTSKDDPAIDVQNVVRQRNNRWLEAERFTGKSVYLYLAPIINTDVGTEKPTDTTTNPDTTDNNQVVDTVSHFSADNPQVSHPLYEGSSGNCNYGYLFGHSCNEAQAFAEKFEFADSVHVKGLFAYVVSEDQSIVSQDSVGFSLYKAVNDTPGEPLTIQKKAIQNLTVQDTSAGNSSNYSNFSYTDFTDTVIIDSTESIFSGFHLPEYESNYTNGNHSDTLALRTTKHQSGNNEVNAIQSADGSWQSTNDAIQQNLNVKMMLAPVVSTNIPDYSDTTEDSSDTTGDDNSGVKPLVKKGTLGLVKSYPNPVESMFNVEVTLDDPSNVNVHVFSVKGRHVHKENLGNLNAGNHTLSLNLATLEKGQYIYTVETGKGMLSGKLTKQ